MKSSGGWAKGTVAENDIVSGKKMNEKRQFSDIAQSC